MQNQGKTYNFAQLLRFCLFLVFTKNFSNFFFENCEKNIFFSYIGCTLGTNAIKNFIPPPKKKKKKIKQGDSVLQIIVFILFLTSNILQECFEQIFEHKKNFVECKKQHLPKSVGLKIQDTPFLRKPEYLRVVLLNHCIEAGFFFYPFFFHFRLSFKFRAKT